MLKSGCGGCAMARRPDPGELFLLAAMTLVLAIALVAAIGIMFGGSQ